MKRVVVAGLHHESNTFNPIVTSRGDFSIHYGEQLFDAINDEDSISGIVMTLRAAGYDVIPTVTARAVPNGEVDGDLYRELRDEIVERVRRAEPFDALVLSLHGSMRVRGLGKAEGDFLKTLRSAYPDTLIVTSLDMHATITPEMTDNADGFVGYKQAPHTDCFETGVHAAQIAIDALERGAKPTMAACRIPVLIAGEKSETSTEPMKTLIERLRSVERRPGIMAASLLLGFPWADSPENGVCALVVADGDADLACATAREIARDFWSRREDFQFHTESYAPADALDTALEAALTAGDGDTPIYVSDSGDNPTAGSAGDNTAFLQLILQEERVGRLPEPLLYAGVYDPAAVERCLEVEGRSLELRFGAAFDTVGSTPTTATGRVVRTARNWGAYHTDLALFRVGNVEIVLASTHLGWVTPEIFRALGVEPATRQVIVVKLGYLTAAQRAVAARSIMALTPGNSNELLETLPYRLIPRPIFPLDRDMAFEPS